MFVMVGLVDRIFCLVLLRWPLCVAMVSSRCLDAFFTVSSGQLAKKSALIAWRSVAFDGAHREHVGIAWPLLCVWLGTHW